MEHLDPGEVFQPERMTRLGIFILLAGMAAACAGPASPTPTRAVPVTLVSTMGPAGPTEPPPTVTSLPSPTSSNTPFPSSTPPPTLTPSPTPLPTRPPSVVIGQSAGDQPLEIGTRLVFVSQRAGTYSLYSLKDGQSEPVPMIQTDQAHYAPAWSPDGSSLAFLTAESYQPGTYQPSSEQVWLHRSGSTFPLTPDRKLKLSELTWSPDGSRLAVTGSLLEPDLDESAASNIFLVDPGTETYAQISDASPGGVGCSSPAWAPDGQELAFRCRGGMVSGVVVSQLDGSPSHFTELWAVDRVVWLPGGERLAFTGGPDPLMTISAASLRDQGGEDFPDSGLALESLSEVLTSLSYQSKPIRAFGWHPENAELFYVQSADLIQVIDLGSGRVVSILGNYRGLEGQVSWAPDGTRIALAFLDGTDAEIGVADLGAEIFTRVTNNLADDRSPAWQPAR